MTYNNNYFAQIEEKEEQIVVTISKEALLIVINNHPDGYKITDEGNFFKYFCENWFHYREEENGDTPFSKSVDGLIEEAYEDGEEFVKNLYWDDEDE
ncbi:hypothetical protein EBB07_28585 [Paenibacillaceae bacterium]|nr:hypothetical protein EBB07_28585 [Paenibacillaceae bacterium]